MLVGEGQGGNSGEGVEIDTNPGSVFGALDRARPRPCLLTGVGDRPARSPFGERRCLVVCLVPLIQIQIVGLLP